MKRGTLVWLVGLAGALTGLAEERRYSVPLFGAAADQRQGFVRLVNHSAATGTAQVYAIDDAGERRGPATLDFAPRQALHFNSNDLQQGNASKGIEGVGAPGAGDWRLEMASALDLEVLAYLRTTPGGFLASMHDLAPEADGAHRIAIFNPGSNANQRSRLRLVNAGATAATVTIRGVDDAGEAGAADISLALPGGEARTLDAKDMEDGAPGVFQGALGDGEGKWRLTVSADQPIQAMSLLDARETGLRANLSTAPRNAETSGGATTHRVPLFPPKSHATQQGFLRVANRSPEAGDVRITAVDDEGASRGPLTLTIAAGATAHINSTDLEDGNRAKGLSGGAGEGDGNWRLALRTSLDVDVLAYVRTRDGFLASMHDLAPAAASSSHRVAMFNPARNANQRSRLRLINDNDEDATVAIAGVDDRGATGAGAVRIVVPANAARDYSAADLESGANRSVQVFEESWDGGAIDPGRWDEYGQPRPRIVEALQGGSNVFDNNGDGNHGSGAVTARGIDLGSGAATIAADVYVDFSDPAGCWADAAIGLTRDAEARTSATGFGAQGIWLALKARGDACAGTPAEHRRRAWFFGGMLDADGNWERMTPYTVGGDDYVDAWHRLRIVVDASNRVSFHVDGTLLWQSTGTLDPALRSGRRLALGTHSSGRAGKAYIDNISVSATPRTIVAGALGAGRGKWRLTVESNRRIGVMGLLESPAGHLTNLSAGGAALPNQRPVVTIPADAEVAEGEVLNVAASASDPDGSIASWRWEQISGPAFDLHRTDAPRLVATAPFVENDETAVFRVAATDDRRGTTTATLRVRVNASALALVAVRTEVSIPAQVSNVRAADVVVASLESDSGRVRADQSATLLIGSDADGTVALSLANEDGGLMGEGSRPVGVGIDSTAVALVAVAAGYRIPDIDQAVVGRIMARDRYDELTQLLTGLMAVDKNYLDRLYDYGDAVALVKAVADAVRAAEQSSPAGFRRSPARPRALPSWPVHDTSSLARPQAETGPIAMRRKNDFYCVPALRWPCSPWMPHEPWNWFGDASGAEALFGGRVLEWVRFLVSPISLSPSEAFRLIDGYAEIVTELVGEAAHPPFLAVSKDSLHSFCLFDCANVHAAANPNFVNYAMELYDDGVYRDWFYTPRNLTVVDKLLNSGAAYRELLAGADRADAGVQLGPDIDLVRFQRYRFARAGDGPERDGRRMVNFMNAFHLVIAGLNVFTDLSEVGKAANQISEKSAGRHRTLRHQGCGGPGHGSGGGLEHLRRRQPGGLGSDACRSQGQGLRPFGSAARPRVPQPRGRGGVGCGCWHRSAAGGEDAAGRRRHRRVGEARVRRLQRDRPGPDVLPRSFRRPDRLPHRLGGGRSRRSVHLDRVHQPPAAGDLRLRAEGRLQRRAGRVGHGGRRFGAADLRVARGRLERRQRRDDHARLPRRRRLRRRSDGDRRQRPVGPVRRPGGGDVRAGARGDQPGVRRDGRKGVLDGGRVRGRRRRHRLGGMAQQRLGRRGGRDHRRGPEPSGAHRFGFDGLGVGDGGGRARQQDLEDLRGGVPGAAVGGAGDTGAVAGCRPQRDAGPGRLLRG